MRGGQRPAIGGWQAPDPAAVDPDSAAAMMGPVKRGRGACGTGRGGPRNPSPPLFSSSTGAAPQIHTQLPLCPLLSPLAGHGNGATSGLPCGGASSGPRRVHPAAAASLNGMSRDLAHGGGRYRLCCCSPLFAAWWQRGRSPSAAWDWSSSCSSHKHSSPAMPHVLANLRCWRA
ncbi:hypothetical protein C2845_PMPSC016551 [Panicum miliaceum]|uniref:Uncharacterized protein n=1 Tax=Panicum miliaceum TaxID=4540 RepID=A0A3L6PB67_PANMI|nr:hypothetical protein C2845_PMPSC016551 [Panicum miliaceum]